MTYDEFVDKCCDGMKPTPSQEAAVRQFLKDPKAHTIWTSGHGGGKSTVQEWFQRYFAEHPEQRDNPLIERFNRSSYA